MFNSEGEWKAKVLEVRALDKHHRHLRIVWVENLGDILGHLSPYYRERELFAGKDMCHANCNHSYERVSCCQSGFHRYAAVLLCKKASRKCR